MINKTIKISNKGLNILNEKTPTHTKEQLKQFKGSLGNEDVDVI